MAAMYMCYIKHQMHNKHSNRFPKLISQCVIVNCDDSADIITISWMDVNQLLLL